jgi:formate-dependent nitrite reductase membrane component NrfD
VTTPYGRHRVDVLGAVPVDQPPPTYYGQPSLKRSRYGWLIVSYLFVGGLAGSAQVIALMADLFGHRRDRAVVRSGRYLALLGSLIGPAVLIRDLHTPSRWYNMLRVFRPTSPMSIGSWTLAAFGTCSGLTVAGQVAEDLGLSGIGRLMGRCFGVPAGLLGMLMSVYTGVLLSATSTPLWSVAYRHLPALFGATGVASANGALMMLLTLASAPRTTLARLDQLALAAGTAQLALTSSAEQTWTRAGVAHPLEEEPLASMHRLGVIGLGIALPLVVNTTHVLTGRRSRSLGLLAALVTLVGAYLERAVVVFAGNRSAERPDDYFHLARRDGRA